MGSLKDAVAAMTVQRGQRCGIALLRTSLPPDLLADFDDLLAGPTWSTVIAKAVRDLGYPLKQDALQRHRRGACECPPR